MTPAAGRSLDLSAISARHRPDPHFPTVCDKCKGLWPCDAAVLLEEVQKHRELMATLDRIAEHTGNETGPGTGECDGDECVACTIEHFR